MDFLFHNGRPQPYNALQFWDDEVRNNGHYYYYPQRFSHSRKEIGQMKHFLIEMKRDNDLTEDDIRRDIHEYVRRWQFVKPNDRRLFIPMPSGLLWERKMPDWPDFGFFFMARRVIIGVLMTAEVPEVPEAKVKRLRLRDVCPWY